MTTQPTGAAELPEALRLADLLLALQTHLGPRRDEEDPDEQAAWDGYTDAAAELRRQHALLNEQQRTIEALNSCINGEGSTTTENLRLVDRLHAENEALQRELVKESHRTAEQKLRADQMTDQHRHQAALNREAREELAALRAQPAGAADQDGEAFRTAALLGLTLRFYGGCAQSSIPGTPSAYEVVPGSDRAARAAPQPATADILRRWAANREVKP